MRTAQSLVEFVDIDRAALRAARPRARGPTEEALGGRSPERDRPDDGCDDRARDGSPARVNIRSARPSSRSQRSRARTGSTLAVELIHFSAGWQALDPLRHVVVSAGPSGESDRRRDFVKTYAGEGSFTTSARLAAVSSAALLVELPFRRRLPCSVVIGVQGCPDYPSSGSSAHRHGQGSGGGAGAPHASDRGSDRDAAEGHNHAPTDDAQRRCSSCPRFALSN